MADPRLRSPAFERNVDPIRDALSRLIGPGARRVLEIGSGPGEHAAALAAAFPETFWTPSDPEISHRASADAWRASAGLANLAQARDIDAASDWSDAVSDIAPLDLVLAVNVLHIAPWRVAEGLMRGAGRVLRPGGALAIYGPFREPGVEIAPSNRAFDASLRARDAEWGLRDLDELNALARRAALEPDGAARLPANNLLVTWRARAPRPAPRTPSPSR